jgi:hypothetical protein
MVPDSQKEQIDVASTAFDLFVTSCHTPGKSVPILEVAQS